MDLAALGFVLGGKGLGYLGRTGHRAARIVIGVEAVRGRRGVEEALGILVAVFQHDVQTLLFHDVEHPVHGFGRVLDPARPFLLVGHMACGILLHHENPFEFRGVLVVLCAHFLLEFRSECLVRTAAPDGLGAGGE